MKQYVQTDLEADRQVAITLAELIISGSLVSIENGPSRGAAYQALVHKSVPNLMRKAPSLFEKGPLALVAGGGFEPPTSGL